jgi:hypothetical protein
MQFTWHEAQFDSKQNLPVQALIQTMTAEILRWREGENLWREPFIQIVVVSAAGLCAVAIPTTG